MARAYAGILASGAFAAVVCRGVLHGTQPSAVLSTAMMAVGLFLVVGAILGAIAAAAVRHAVQDQLQAELNQIRRSTDSSPS